MNILTAFDSVTYQSIRENDVQFIGTIGEEKYHFGTDEFSLFSLNNQSNPQKKIGTNESL